ncbi:MAG: PKD domain-containing protein, partial [Akkermansiaceae bacterium]|nr:PKD domain-containing protein [Akkermansiaceae bacterium]
MKELIRRDPQRALAQAVPYEVRRKLPREVLQLLEEPVNVTGDIEVWITCGLDRSDVSRTDHFAQLPDGRQMRLFPYGRRLDVTTKRGISLHGIAIDDLMAVADDPLRVVPDGERAARGLKPGAVEIGGRLYEIADMTDLARLRKMLRDDEMTLGPLHLANYRALRDGMVEGVVAMTAGDGDDPAGGDDPLPPPPPSAWTEGAKTMLYIRARFADQDPAFDPIPLSTLQTRQGKVEQFWSDNSYGKGSLTTTITDTVTLSFDAPATTAGKPSLSTILADARSAAVAANSAWNYQNFDFYTVLTQGGAWGYGGIASVGGRGSHLNGAGAANVRTASHEFGHNLGLRHANYWRTDSPSPIGRDSFPGYRGDGTDDERVEYGHKFSVMSAQGGGGDLDNLRGHYTPGEKVRLDWLEQADNDWISVTGSSSVRLYRHDIPEAEHAARTLNVPRAIKINLDSDDYVSSPRRYWLTYRRLPTNGIAETWLRRGLQVDWQRNSYGSNGAIQLDMTPYSRDSTTVGGNWTTDNNDKEDAALIIGRTYTDAAKDIHFTPVAQGGSSPNEYIDVEIRVGTQGSNSEPEITALTASGTAVGTGVAVNFSVTATDSDGDDLAYSWDFADNSLVVAALNSPTATKSWGSAGQYVVRATVSDMKGGTDTRDVLITVGNPTNFN